MAKIVILDAFTANPGDLSWCSLDRFGDVTVWPRTAPGEVISRAADAEIVLTNKTILSAETIAALPKLKYIGVLATGTNVVEIKAAGERGIVVTNIPSYSTNSVAQLVFAFILALIYRPEHYTAKNRALGWSRCADFSYTDFPLFELAGKTLGIVGFGHIGRRVAEIGRAFGMRIALCTSRPQSELPEGCLKMERDDLFAASDVVTLHCPLAPDTKGMIDARALSLMKPTAFLVNTGRGPLVDEQALADALREGKIAGAAVDVLSQEPPAENNPLLNAPNILVTPHIGWATKEARERLVSITEANIAAFLDGSPVNVVS